MITSEFIQDRQEHWEKAAEAAQRALDYAKRQLENCHQMKLLISDQVQLVLLHGGEE